MNLFSKIKGLFGRSPGKLDEKSFSEIVASAGSDWATSGISIDADVFQNHFSLKTAMWDLWKCNSTMAKYAEQLAANVYGEAGIMLRSKITETEDRVVNTPDEKWALIKHEERINRIREWAERKTGIKTHQYRAFKLADELESRSHDEVIRGKATILVGSPDVYANQRTEAWWAEWQRANNCDVRGRRSYNALRQIRLWSAARDGGHFVRLIKDSSVNEMGFAIQLINDEWVDYFFNIADTGNGTTIRMGIEYPFTAWGIGKPIAYYFIKRMPRDWQTNARYGGTQQNSYATRERVPADQIIHYARFMDTDSTRPAPWGVSMLGKVRQLDQYEVAEVIAARMQACVTGWLWSDVVPEGGDLPGDAEKRAKEIRMTPGGLYGLPYGVKFQGNDPTHPSGNFQNFRQGMGQSIAAALPGGDYNILFNDLANINFSAGRLGRLDTNEQWKMLQRWDIDTAERPIFEAGLEMALITGYLPFTFSKAKYAKLNKPHFQGRRWAQVDENKAIDAAAKRIANKLSSRSKECAEEGIDFEDNAIELAEEDMILEGLGLRTDTTAQGPVPTGSSADEEDDDDTEAGDEKPPKGVAADTNGTNGKSHKKLTKGKRIALIK